MNDHLPDNTEPQPGALVNCPACGLPAEVIDRFTLGGAPGPVEHVKAVCARRHWYTLAVDRFQVSGPVSAHTSHARTPSYLRNTFRGLQLNSAVEQADQTPQP